MLPSLSKERALSLSFLSKEAKVSEPFRRLLPPIRPISPSRLGLSLPARFILPDISDVL